MPSVLVEASYSPDGQPPEFLCALLQCLENRNIINEVRHNVKEKAAL